jgi:hypothetical protein
MATLAEQLESALEGTGSAMSASNIEDMLSGTATSITPGTVTPITPQQSNQLSWNQVFNKIGEGVTLKPGEGLPEVPKNIPASTFYRTATQAGKLPSGGAQFFTKPLAPETKPWKLTDTPTTTTPATTSATTSQQNIVRQMREAVDLSPQDDSMGDEALQKSFEEGVGAVKSPDHKDIDYWAFVRSNPDYAAMPERTHRGPTTLAAHEQYMQQQLVDAYDAYDKGDPSQLQALGFSPDVAAMQERARARKDFAGEIVTFEDVQEGRKNIAEYTKYRTLSKIFDVTQMPKDIMAEPLKEIPKAGLGFLASMKLGPTSMLVKPLLDAMFSEGGGQIGMTALISDDYWGKNEKEGGVAFGTKTFAAVYGYANTGSGMAKAVDKHGNILADLNGVGRLGFTNTKRGQAVWDAKQAEEDAKKAGVVGEETVRFLEPSESVVSSDDASGGGVADPSDPGEVGYSDDPSGEGSYGIF